MDASLLDDMFSDINDTAEREAFAVKLLVPLIMEEHVAYYLVSLDPVYPIPGAAERLAVHREERNALEASMERMGIRNPFKRNLNQV